MCSLAEISHIEQRGRKGDKKALVLAGQSYGHLVLQGRGRWGCLSSQPVLGDHLEGEEDARRRLSSVLGSKGILERARTQYRGVGNSGPSF